MVTSQHIDDVKRAEQAYHEDQAIQDICDVNGLTREDFVHGRLHISFLEMFLSDFSSMAPMIFFPGLKVCAMAQHQCLGCAGRACCSGQNPCPCPLDLGASSHTPYGQVSHCCPPPLSLQRPSPVPLVSHQPLGHKQAPIRTIYPDKYPAAHSNMDIA